MHNRKVFLLKCNAENISVKFLNFNFSQIIITYNNNVTVP